MRKGDTVWMLGFGSGFKVGSCVLVALKTFKTNRHTAWQHVTKAGTEKHIQSPMLSILGLSSKQEVELEGLSVSMSSKSVFYLPAPLRLFSAQIKQNLQAGSQVCERATARQQEEES